MQLTKKMLAYADKWLQEHNTACEHGLDADIGMRVKRWFYEDILSFEPSSTSLEALKERVHDDIASMVWDELGDACDALERL